MKRFTILLFATLLTGAHVNAAPGDDGQSKPKHSKHEQREASTSDKDRTSVQIHFSFSNRDVRVLREYYAPRYKKLPPGLQKKLARGGQLPPGWQKKIEPMPVVLERDMVVLPPDYRRGVIDGHAVVYNPKTQVILDVTVLF